MDILRARFTSKPHKFAILTSLTKLTIFAVEDAMTQKTQQHRPKEHKGPEIAGGRESRTGKVTKAPRAAKTGRYVIVKPKQTKAKTIVGELARQGLFVAAVKGTSLSAIEKKLKAVAQMTMPLRSTETARVEEPRARLVGTGLTRSERKDDLPWVTGDELEAAIDIAATLSSDEIAKRLNTNRETIKQWRAAGRLLGVEGAKRGVRYPVAQVGKNLAPLEGIKEVLEAMGGDAWEAWRFLAGEIDELEGKTGFDVLRSGGMDDLLEVIEARSHGSFS
jgi:hypothetical protein